MANDTKKATEPAVYDNLHLSPLEKPLLDRGFEPLYRNAYNEMVWQDPEGEGSKKPDPEGVTLRLPNKKSDTGQKETIVHQMTVPPCSWKLTTSAALRILKLRDAAASLTGEAAASPLIRLDLLGKRYDSTCEILEQLLLKLTPLLKRPTPEKKENLERELAETRRLLHEAIDAARGEYSLLAPKKEIKDVKDMSKGEGAA